MTNTPPQRVRSFKQVDVFISAAYRGNPVAVVLDGRDLTDEQMQNFARWTNLSETTFVLPATKMGADYKIRIFTPGGELPFAGHPTLGTCHAWLEAGGNPKSELAIVQECQLGLINIQRHKNRLAFAAPPLKSNRINPALLVQVATALGVEQRQILAAQLLDNGPIWLGLLLDNQDTVLGLKPDHHALKILHQKVGVAALIENEPAPGLIARSNREASAFASPTRLPAALATPLLEVRAFAAAIGVNEDPVTGSLNASLAQWLITEGHLPPSYVAAQGACLGRDGRVYIARDDRGQVWVGGESLTCIDGKVVL